MTKHLVCLMTALIAIGGCKHTVDQKKVSPVGPLPAGSFARQWTAELDFTKEKDNARSLHPLDKWVFVHTRRNVSYCLDRAGGALQFIADVDVAGGVLREPIRMGDYLVYPTSSTLEIFNLQGRVLKSVPLDSPTGASGVGEGNIVYIGVNQLRGYGRVLAMDITRPAAVPRWSVLTRGAITGRPAFYERTIFVGSDDGSLLALTTDGTAHWVGLPNHIFSTRGQFLSDIYADETGVYAANTDSKLYVLDRNTGKILWQYYSGSALKTAPEVTATTVYQYVPGNGIVALDKAAGGYNREPKWNVKSAVQFLSDDDTHAYLRKQDNTLLAVDKQTGKIDFTSKTRKFSVFTSNTTTPIIYAATPEGAVVAIRPVLAPGETGEIVLRLEETPLGG